MKQSERTVFQCEFCRRNMLVKKACIKHEENCTKNPKNWAACSGCIHLQEFVKYYDIDHPYTGYQEMKSKGFKCVKLNIEVYPKKAEKYALRYPETFEGSILMPVECGEYSKDRFPF